MAQRKGATKVGGRAKGTPNKVTAAVKDMVVQALSESGGVKYLREQAKTNPTAFLGLVGRVIPLQVNGSGDAGEHLHRIEHVIIDPVHGSSKG